MTDAQLTTLQALGDVHSPSWPVTVTLAQLTQYALVTPAQTRKARDHGVVAEPFTLADVVALKVYIYVSSVLWPGRERPRNEPDRPDVAMLEAAQIARMLALESDLPQDAVMFVTPERTIVARTRGERVDAEIDKLHGVAVRVPIGNWIAVELPALLANPPRSKRTIQVNAARAKARAGQQRTAMAVA